jgi:hypothetical protein
VISGGLNFTLLGQELLKLNCELRECIAWKGPLFSLLIHGSTSQVWPSPCSARLLPGDCLKHCYRRSQLAAIKFCGQPRENCNSITKPP